MPPNILFPSTYYYAWQSHASVSAYIIKGMTVNSFMKFKHRYSFTVAIIFFTTMLCQGIIGLSLIKRGSKQLIFPLLIENITLHQCYQTTKKKKKKKEKEKIYHVPHLFPICYVFICHISLLQQFRKATLMQYCDY